jgi:hypothetical protein
MPVQEEYLWFPFRMKFDRKTGKKILDATYGYLPIEDLLNKVVNRAFYWAQKESREVSMQRR